MSLWVMEKDEIDGRTISIAETTFLFRIEIANIRTPSNTRREKIYY
jgi:hypothetical protein